jgi:hypothetical protein
MNAVVVYESVWGNTAAIARAIAEGIGPETRTLSTTDATPGALAGVDLLVVGSPLFGFSVPSDRMIEGIRTNPSHPKDKTDTSQPSMAAWLATVPEGTALVATFETRIWWSPGSAAKGIAKALAAKGYRPIDPKGERFMVKGYYGPLKDGEIDRARAWGAGFASLSK